MKTILVTGAQGFVGSAIVSRLSDYGHRVVPLVRKSNGEHLDVIEWDITKPLERKIDNVDVVIHAAAKVDDWADYHQTYSANVIGTKNLVEAFPEAKLFVYISSASVYGSNNKERIITEESPAGTNLLNSYSKTKYLGEQVALRSVLSSVVILRPHIIYGKDDKSILPRLLRARKFGRFLVLGKGDNLISLTHIDNLVDAVLQLINSDKTFHREVFNIADDKTDTVENIINSLKLNLNIHEKNLHIPKLLAKIIGMSLENVFRFFGSKKPPLITRYVVEQMTSDHVLDCRKAKLSFGFKPKVEYSEGFKNL